MRKIPLQIVLVMTLLGLGGVATADQGLDVNDVSILLPINEHGPYPAFGLDQLPGLSDENFSRVLTFENPGTPLEQLPYTDARFMAKRSGWRLVSWRFDPCGENFHFSPSAKQSVLVASELPGCTPRLRLVFQPQSVFEQPLASALHLLYRLDDRAALDLAARLARMRDQSAAAGTPTLRLPLIVHPGLTQEMQQQTRTLSDFMLETVEQSAQSGELEFITLAVRATVNHWRFVGGTIQNGVWTRFVSNFSQRYYDWDQTGLLVGVEDITCDQLSVCSLQPLKADSVTEEALALNDIFTTAQRNEQIPGQRRLETRLKAELIDDARRTNFFSTNCISCHQSTNLRDRTSLLNSQTSNTLGPTPFVPKRYLSDKTSNVINFGYFGTIPRISTRTAAESVVAAERVNQLLGLTYSATQLSDSNTFWACLMSQPNYQTCLTN